MVITHNTCGLHYTAIAIHCIALSRIRQHGYTTVVYTWQQKAGRIFGSMLLIQS